jgi:chaperonin GroES
MVSPFAIGVHLMATALEIIEPEAEQTEEPTRAFTMADILQPGVNLAEMLDEEVLNKIGQNVIRDVETDTQSRGDWEDRYERNIKIAMQTKEPKVFPWAKASNSKSPILTVASIRFNAEAYPVIVDGSNLVKGRVLGPDPDGQKRARADRIGQHMTWQLLYRMPGWEADTDRLLLMLPIVGCMFRKTYYDSIANSNRSEIVDGLDFIINNDAKSIETAPRYTHVLHLYPYEARELIGAGMWLDVPIEGDDRGEDEEGIVDFYEQHRCEDIDGDGYPEHYVVTCTTEGKVARIVPCFGPEDITVQASDGSQIAKLDKVFRDFNVPIDDVEALDAVLAETRIVKIDRRQYFTKYGFIPSPDGSFYDIGFGDLLENVTGLIDTLQNQMIDAASLANAGGGFVGSGVNIRGGSFRFQIGEWKRVDAGPGALQDNFMALPAPGPSAVSFNLLEMLMGSARDITSSQEVVAGRAPPNQPATTTLALIEQAGTVRKGIFKRIHRAFGGELRILRRLNRDYLDEEEYFQLNDAEEAVKIAREDYADEDLDVIPVSDPSQISDMHKMARAEAMMQTFNGDPLINQRLIRQNMLEAMGARDVKAFFDVPPPQPDPKMLVETAKVEATRQDSDTRALAGAADAANKFMEAAGKAVELGLIPDATVLAARAVEESPDGQDPDAAAGPGAVPGMEGPPGDGGVLPVPEGPAMGADAGMGPGPDMEPGAAGAGGFAGPAGGDQFG